MNNMWVVALAALLAGFVQAVTGFGGAIVIMMFLPNFMSMNLAPALTSIICIPLCIAIAWKYRKDVNKSFILVPAVIYLISSGIAIKVASTINLDNLKAVFGLLLVVLAIYFSFFSDKLKLKGDIKTAFVCAGISGVTGGMLGIGGPLMVLYYLAVTENKREYLGTINVVFIITETYSTAMRFYNGIIKWTVFPMACVGIAAILAGRFAGSRAADGIDEKVMRKCIYGLLAIAGIITLAKAI